MIVGPADKHASQCAASSATNWSGQDQILTEIYGNSHLELW